jgi:lipopolysaccharide assembly protein A
MQFLRTIFWVAIAVIAVIFAFNNWTPVTITLWGGMLLDTRLPILLLAAFLLGLVPYFILHRATRWSLRRKLDSAERALAEVRGTPVESIQRAEPLPPAAAPIAVPPGV